MAKTPEQSLTPGPRPWTQAGPYSVLDALGASVCTFSGPNKAQNRARVLAAVNRQAEPLAAIVEYVAAVAAWRALETRPEQPFEQTLAAAARMQVAEQALVAMAQTMAQEAGE